MHNRYKLYQLTDAFHERVTVIPENVTLAKENWIANNLKSILPFYNVRLPANKI